MQAYLYYSQMNSEYTDASLIELGRQALNIEIDGLRAQLPRLGTDFARACRICLNCRGRIVVTGMGKSGPRSPAPARRRFSCIPARPVTAMSA